MKFRSVCKTSILYFIGLFIGFSLGCVINYSRNRTLNTPGLGFIFTIRDSIINYPELFMSI